MKGCPPLTPDERLRRLMLKVNISESGCHLWTRRTTSVCMGPRIPHPSARVAVWVLTGHAPLATDEWLEATCGDTRCIRPEHMVIRGSLEADRRLFLSRLAPGPSGCLDWQGSVAGNGYGECNIRGERRAHRVAWLLFHGPIPDGLGVLHRCDRRICCASDHLFLGTAADNTADMIAKGRGRFWGRAPRLAAPAEATR